MTHGLYAEPIDPSEGSLDYSCDAPGVGVVARPSCACPRKEKSTFSSAHTLTEVTSREPVGCVPKIKEDSAMAARRTITVVDIVAETLLTLA